MYQKNQRNNPKKHTKIKFLKNSKKIPNQEPPIFETKKTQQKTKHQFLNLEIKKHQLSKKHQFRKMVKITTKKNTFLPTTTLKIKFLYSFSFIALDSTFLLQHQNPQKFYF